MFHEHLTLLSDKLVRKMKLNEVTSCLLILFCVLIHPDLLQIWKNNGNAQNRRDLYI